jgi:hypothetical protein
MEQHDHTISEVRGILSECFQEMRLARATELACSRRYLEATALLTPQGRLPADAKELDLLARIAAQQRRFVDAERLWNDASRVAPENTTYRETATRAARARQNWIQIKQTVFAVVVALVLAGIILGTISLLTGRSHKPASATTGPATPAGPVPSKP